MSLRNDVHGGERRLGEVLLEKCEEAMDKVYPEPNSHAENYRNAPGPNKESRFSTVIRDAERDYDREPMVKEPHMLRAYVFMIPKECGLHKIVYAHTEEDAVAQMICYACERKLPSFVYDTNATSRLVVKRGSFFVKPLPDAATQPLDTISAHFCYDYNVSCNTCDYPEETCGDRDITYEDHKETYAPRQSQSQSQCSANSNLIHKRRIAP